MIYDEDWVLFGINPAPPVGSCLHQCRCHDTRCITCQLIRVSDLVLLIGVLYISVGMILQTKLSKYGIIS